MSPLVLSCHEMTSLSLADGKILTVIPIPTRRSGGPGHNGVLRAVAQV